MKSIRKYIKTIVRKLIPASCARRVRELAQDIDQSFGEVSYSQEGEDRVLSSLLFKLNGGTHIDNGFYVDVGAHHPQKYSNTYLFYQRGWSGLNIDAMPGSMIAFAKQRPRDTNIESGVSLKHATLKYFAFNEPAINTFDESLAVERNNNKYNWKIEKIVEVPVVPLAELLKKHLSNNQRIDFLTVDVEGLDLNVLMSNDWENYRPRIVLAEAYDQAPGDFATDALSQYLESLGYAMCCRTVNTSFYISTKLG